MSLARFGVVRRESLFVLRPMYGPSVIRPIRPKSAPIRGHECLERPRRIASTSLVFGEFQQTQQAGNATVLGCPRLAQPLQTEMNGRLKRRATERAERHKPDDTAFSGLLQVGLVLHFGKKAH